MMLSLKDGVLSAKIVGGKAASLMRQYSDPQLSAYVPGGFALSVDFFGGWVDQVLASEIWAWAAPRLLSEDAASVCKTLKELAQQLPLSPDQARVLQTLKAELHSWPGQLAAVRSSAPEEDGTGASFAGVFETKLGVTADTLEAALRHCFASVFDHRVFSYAGAHRPAFAAVVMEMVDAQVAGVAFSANPLNSDLDEMVVNSSWGLGESVVDGSVTADYYVWDKIGKKLIEKSVRSKTTERRLQRGGGVEARPVSAARQAQSSLSDAQVAQLAALVCRVEEAYGKPMDTEWAYTEGGDLRLLQARPITTIHTLSEKMITPPGERRVLYYDFNIASEATTTSPFTHMDIKVYSKMCAAIMGAPDVEISDNPNMPVFNGATRQYINLSHVLAFVDVSRKTEKWGFDTLDPHMAALFRSDDCSRAKYRTTKLPKDVSLSSCWFLLKKIPVFSTLWKQYRFTQKFKADPAKMKAEYLGVYKDCEGRLKALEQRGATHGLERYFSELMEVLEPAFAYEMGAVQAVTPVFSTVEEARRSGKTGGEREDAEALSSGYDGDPVMETNIAMYSLARELPSALWSEYSGRLSDLAARITANLRAEASDLPQGFVEAWRAFIDKYGYDGADQLFVSAPRYAENPELVLGLIRNMLGASVQDPVALQKAKCARRREVMARQEAAAGMFSVGGLRRRNQILEHLMSIRNSPKQQFARIFADLRTAVLAAQERLLADGRLASRDDVFHLELQEVDRAFLDPGFDLKAALAPRKALYEKCSRAQCPMLVDSRCRILRPNAPVDKPGVLAGFAVSPGVASGRIRLVTSPADPIEPGEVLAAFVTDPCWTPLFVNSAAVVLQVGGALQHGALCARELGKPAVSGIDVTSKLTTGMLVEVDGNAGTVRILEEGEGHA